MNNHLRNLCRLLESLAILSIFASVLTVSAQTRQEHVHEMAHSVMPFDISKTVHIFKMTESGGVQRVIAKDPNATDQIALIQTQRCSMAHTCQGSRSFTPELRVSRSLMRLSRPADKSRSKPPTSIC